jgi:hypothetical protein
VSRQNRAAPHAEGDQHEYEDDAERPRHRPMRNHRVERAFAVGVCRQQHRAIDGERHREQQQRGASDQHDACDHAIALEQLCQRIGPRVLLVRFDPQIRQQLRKVQLELVRRRVLARVVAGSAVVAEIREVSEIASSNESRRSIAGNTAQ